MHQQSEGLSKRQRENNNDEPDSKKAKCENIETEGFLLTEQVIPDQRNVGLSADIQNCKELKSRCYKFFDDFFLQKGEIKEEINRRGHNDIVLPLHLYFEECMGSLDSQVHDVAEHRYGENIVLMDGANIVSYSLLGDIKILSHTTGECLCSLKGHGCQIYSLINLGNKDFCILFK